MPVFTVDLDHHLLVFLQHEQLTCTRAYLVGQQHVCILGLLAVLVLL